MAVKIEVRRGQGQGQGQQGSGDDSWTPWRYYSADCAADFPLVPEVEFPSQVEPQVVCMRKYYAGDVTTNPREVMLSHDQTAR